MGFHFCILFLYDHIIVWNLSKEDGFVLAFKEIVYSREEDVTVWLLLWFWFLL